MNSPNPELRKLTTTSTHATSPAFSPDGRWIAYTSRETGRPEVYVRPYPSMEPKTQVSTNRGTAPVWAPNGRELFFVGGPARKDWWLTAVGIDTTGGRVPLGAETKLFPTDARGLYTCAPVVCYSVTPDGQRFLMHKFPLASGTPPATSIDVVLNWFEELKAKVPVKR